VRHEADTKENVLAVATPVESMRSILAAVGLLLAAVGATLTYSSDHSVISLIFTCALRTATGAAWANVLSARRMQRRPPRLGEERRRRRPVLELVRPAKH
jgi:hypothetical protein